VEEFDWLITIFFAGPYAGPFGGQQLKMDFSDEIIERMNLYELKFQ
jgi:hypothetical protein